MPLQTAIPLLIFILTYVVLAAGRLPLLRLDRTGAAPVGAVAMVVIGAVSERQAELAIDFRTLALLLGMMIVVANLRLSGAFMLVARLMLRRAKSALGLLAITVAVSGVLAAFFINDVVCLALTPLLIEATGALGLDPAPFLLALATASNIGSAATITGNPQNMIVAGFAHLGYGGFLARLAPAAIAGLVIDYAVIALAYLGRLRGFRFDGDAPLPSRSGRVHRPLLIKSVIIATGTLVCFAIGFDTHLVALSAGALLLLTRRVNPRRVYGQVDWTMLLMFAGLFVVVAGAESTGFQNDLIKLVGVRHLTDTGVLAMVTAILSNLVSNVPAVMLFRPLYPLLGGSPRVALVLASASTFAGNLTVPGSIANLIVIEQARREGVEIGFREYLRVGVPITLLTLAVDVALLNLVR